MIRSESQNAWANYKCFSKQFTGSWTPSISPKTNTTTNNIRRFIMEASATMKDGAKPSKPSQFVQ